MKCPNCDRVLGIVDFRGIKIHECGQCQGRWFAREELNKAKDKMDEDLRWLDFDPFEKTADGHPSSEERKDCPQCQQSLDPLIYSESQVQLKRCLQCRGVWVAQGEFEKLIQYLEEVLVSKPAPEYVKDSLKQLLEIATGKDDAEEELKDFLVVVKLSEERLGVEHPAIAQAINKIYEYLPFL